VTLNYNHGWVIRPVLPNTLPKFSGTGKAHYQEGNTRYKPVKLLRGTKTRSETAATKKRESVRVPKGKECCDSRFESV
jgi:hypothetical protein